MLSEMRKKNWEYSNLSALHMKKNGIIKRKVRFIKMHVLNLVKLLKLFLKDE